MKASKPLMIALVLILLVLIGYAFYLHQGPMKRIAEENQKLVAEIEQCKTASRNLKAGYKAELDEKIRWIEDLERKTGELEETVSRIKNEKHVTDADVEKLKSSIALLESRNEALSVASDDLGRKLLDAQNQLEALRKALDTRNEEVARGAQENEALRKQMDLVVRERDRLDQTRNEFDNQLAALRSRLQSISDDLASKDRKIVEMEETHRTLVSQIERQKKEKEATEEKEKQLRQKEKQLASMEKAMAELSKQFERQIREKEIRISALEDKLNIRLLDKILFASGSADIIPAGRRVLKSVAAELKRMEGFEIEVSGHTDNIPLGPKIKEVYDDNLGLSVARAAAVSRALCKMGVPPEHLSAVGHSMYRPAAGNETEEGRRQNRRVEIILAPLP